MEWRTLGWKLADACASRLAEPYHTASGVVVAERVHKELHRPKLAVTVRAVRRVCECIALTAHWNVEP